jgi:transposase
MNTPITYLGLDIAKASLDLSAGAQTGPRHFNNDPTGGQRLLKHLAKMTGPIHLICEATGGYERRIVEVLAKANIAFTVVNPRRVRDFARARGLLAKTDALDATVLAEYGRKMEPAATPPASPVQQRLHALVTRRQQLVAMVREEQCRQEHFSDPFVCRQSNRLLRALKKAVTEVEEQIEKLLQANDVVEEKVKKLCGIKGVGRRTAWTLLAALPELGTLERGEPAALAGVAPYNYDSGPFRGQRHIAQGRPLARSALYMAALVAAQHHVKLSVFYQRLRGKSKPAKVALVAVMRKLIELANHLLKGPQPKLS